ncbi:ATP-binding protein [Streptomyces albulus]|nr:ATP-binding protein [Streptomyces noursei]
MTLIVAELCANAVRHARVPDRDFRLNLGAHPPPPVRPSSSGWPSPTPSANASRHPSGPAAGRHRARKLAIVAALAAPSGWRHPGGGAPGKTVWAEYTAPVPFLTEDAARAGVPPVRSG